MKKQGYFLFLATLILAALFLGGCSRKEKRSMLNETQKQELKAMDASLLEHRYFQKARKAEDLDAIMAKLRRARSRLLKRKKDLISILKAHGITEETRFHEAERLLNQWLLAENFPTLEK